MPSGKSFRSLISLTLALTRLTTSLALAPRFICTMPATASVVPFLIMAPCRISVPMVTSATFFT